MELLWQYPAGAPGASALRPPAVPALLSPHTPPSLTLSQDIHKETKGTALLQTHHKRHID